MKSKKITIKQWQPYFDTFSLKYLKDEQPEYIEIQLLSEDMGAPQEIQVDKMDHLISHPEEIYVNEEKDGWLSGMMVVRKDGDRSIIDIR